MLKGAKNLSLYKNIFKPAKFVMSYQLLRILGHEIATSNWKQDSKTVFWSACCLAFFGSFRIAEILPGAYSRDARETFVGVKLGWRVICLNTTLLKDANAMA
jgi:hypothetical protein